MAEKASSSAPRVAARRFIEMVLQTKIGAWSPDFLMPRGLKLEHGEHRRNKRTTEKPITGFSCSAWVIALRDALQLCTARYPLPFPLFSCSSCVLRVDVLNAS